MNFETTAKQDTKLKEWLVKHYKKCKTRKMLSKKGICISVPITYCFTPTGIGTEVSVRCDCGKEVDLTDVGDW